MKITVEFNSLDEISEFQRVYVAGNNILEDFIKEEVSKRMPKAAQNRTALRIHTTAITGMSPTII